VQLTVNTGTVFFNGSAGVVSSDSSIQVTFPSRGVWDCSAAVYLELQL
jgi:hypothetical protein